MRSRITPRLRPLWMGVALLAAAGLHLVQAQAIPAASGPGSNVTVGTAFAAFHDPYGQRTLGGRAFFVDISPTWRYTFEAEARTLSMNNDEGVTLGNYFAGVRVAARPGRFMPYGKFLVGAGKINFPFNYAKGTYFAYVPGGGIDFRLNDIVTVRAADFEYQLWQDFTYGSFHPYGVSVGLSFRLNPMRRFPKHAYYAH